MNNRQEVGQIELRDATLEERGQMLAVTLAAYKEFEEGADPGFWKAYMQNISKAINEAIDMEQIIYVINQKIVGSVLLCRKGAYSDEPEIRLLAVDPNYRQKGIAKALMQECEERVSRRGLKQVVLHTTALMQTAREMYERAGYRRYEKIDFTPVPGFVVIGFIKDLP